ncbi:hypothetical protein QFZ96_004702 [Paraburkholderia youngii]
MLGVHSPGSACHKAQGLRFRPRSNADLRILRRTTNELDSGTEKRHDRRLSRLDARRIRFLSDGVRIERYRAGIQYGHSVGRGRDHADPDDAPARRIDFRLARRQIRPPSDADGQHRVLLVARTAVRSVAQPDDAARAARAVRYRDGRRMGCRRRADHGNRAAEIARHRLGSAASRLSKRLSARVDRVRRVLSIHRLARHVLRRRAAGAAGAVHSRARAGVARVPDARKRRYVRASSRRSSRTSACRSTRSS